MSQQDTALPGAAAAAPAPHRLLPGLLVATVLVAELGWVAFLAFLVWSWT